MPPIYCGSAPFALKRGSQALNLYYGSTLISGGDTYSSAGAIVANAPGVAGDTIRSMVTVNQLYKARAFANLSTDQYGTANVTLKANGYPDGSSNVSMVLMTQSADSTDDDGDYLCSFTGTATVNAVVGCTIIDQQSSGGATTFTLRVTPAADTVQIGLSGISGDFSDFKINLPGYAIGTTQLFSDEWLAIGSQFKVWRYMDWTRTNGVSGTDAVDTTWATRRAKSLAHRWSQSWEMAIAHANATNTDMWINLPHTADDDYITKVAQCIKYGSDGTTPYTSVQASPVWSPLNPALNCYVEYSNETWNSAFLQNAYSIAQAVAEAGYIESTGGITSAVVNAGNTLVTVTTVADHGRTTGDQVYTSFLGSFGNPGLKTVTVTGAKTFTVPVSSGFSANQSVTINASSVIILNLVSDLVSHLTTDDEAANRYALARQWCLRKLNQITALFSAVFGGDMYSGGSGRIRPIYCGQANSDNDTYVLRWGSVAYPFSTWLWGYSDAKYILGYTTGSTTTEALALSNSVANSVVQLKDTIRTATRAKMFSLNSALYEYGPDTYGNGTNTVTNAAAIAYSRNTSGVVYGVGELMRDFSTGAVDRGIDMAAYFSVGAYQYASSVQNWYSMESVKTPTASPKWVGLVAALAKQKGQYSTDGETWGSIYLDKFYQSNYADAPFVYGFKSVNGAAVGTGTDGVAHKNWVYVYNAARPLNKTLGMAFVVCAPADGTYNIAPHVGQLTSAQTLTLKVDGVSVGTFSPAVVASTSSVLMAPIASPISVALTRGHHVVSFESATHTTNVACSGLTIS